MTNTNIGTKEAITDILNILCPCVDCICLAICRHKKYLTLFQDCSIVKMYEPHYQLLHKRNYYRIVHLESILHPSMWEYILEKGLSSLYMVSEKETYSDKVYIPKISISGGKNPQ
jgi:hypothetical protein